MLFVAIPDTATRAIRRFVVGWRGGPDRTARRDLGVDRAPRGDFRDLAAVRPARRRGVMGRLAEVFMEVSSRRLASVQHFHLPAHGLLSLLSLLSAFLLTGIKRNQAESCSVCVLVPHPSWTICVLVPARSWRFLSVFCPRSRPWRLWRSRPFRPLGPRRCVGAVIVRAGAENCSRGRSSATESVGKVKQAGGVQAAPTPGAAVPS